MTSSTMGLPPVDERQRRAARYLASMGPAIEGSGGDDHTFRACKVGVRFALDIGDFLPVLLDWNRGCQPPWRERELERKCAATYRNTTVTRGSALQEDADETPAPTVAQPTYPPAREVTWLWDSIAEPPMHEGQVIAPSAHVWVRETLRAPGVELDPERLGPVRGALLRGIEPQRVAAQEHWPSWARTAGVRWGESHYRALFPLYDHHGEIRSVRARWTSCDVVDQETGEVMAEGAEPPRGKAVPPEGYDVRGLVMANETGWWLLQRGEWPEDIPRESRHVWVVEGESDMVVTCARVFASARPLRAVFGIFAGAWTAAIAGRIPKGTVVVVATDFDAKGEQYAALIQRTLQGRCDLRRKKLGTTRSA